MPAFRPNPGVLSGAVLSMLILLALSLGGCAGRTVKPPHTPDESVLAPAQQALAKARDAHAEQFAPRAVAAARRRITTARDILYTAATGERPVNREEQQRIDKLIAAAQLDARSALVQTQAKAVRTKIDELRADARPATGGRLQNSPSSLSSQGDS